MYIRGVGAPYLDAPEQSWYKAVTRELSTLVCSIDEVEAPHQGAKTGRFFAVDGRIWARLCVPGMMNEAVAYLIQARGTGRNNRTTTWSVQSIESYTGISRHRAAAALKNLQCKNFTRLLRGGTKPKYELIPYAAPQRAPLGLIEQRAVDLIAAGEKIPAAPTREYQAACRAADKGWLDRAEGNFTIREEPKPDTDLIWLPNELVTGAAGEAPPLELVRQTQDPMTLRLFIDLYHEHYLREDGGISRRIIWQEFERFEVGNQAQFRIWGFRCANQWVRWENRVTHPHRRELTKEEKAAGLNHGADLFRRLGHLTDLGLLEWMPHLVESGEETGEIIHPIALQASGSSIEERLSAAATDAGSSLITEGQYAWAADNGLHLVVPVPRHLANVQVVGIARLRYRPHTRMTAAWWADLNTNAEKHLARYAEIAARQDQRIAV